MSAVVKLAPQPPAAPTPQQLKARRLAGVALLGFVAWHLSLYKPRQRD